MARLLPIPGRTDYRIDALMVLLAARPMLTISGAQIAREIGVTRHAVWIWVEKLRSLGVRVKGQAGAGYRIERAPDVLVPGLLKPRLRGTIFQSNLYHFFKTASTNDVALELGYKGAPQGAVVIAEEQTAGRGRLGRSWHSEQASGIYVSVVLRPAMPPASASLLTLVAGLAAREAVAGQTGLALDIRWPNDLLLGGRKFAGILTEMYAEPDRIEFVVVGMGINVNQERFPPELAGTATSLRTETGRTHSRLELLVRLLLELEGHYNRFMAEGPGAIIERFGQVSSYARGKRVRIHTATETYTGTTAGLEPGGLLRVRRDGGGVETIISGDVREAS
ncbi:MAG TPA: biotin--[acetyl-CoA-carboxylase] ligase [Candidatus Dormibacteraeota bacterium]|nr:biotin--[acetyl-CoA-carboxylase] ligase [Candidatus Dormibacteraeota bacterium]